MNANSGFSSPKDAGKSTILHILSAIAALFFWTNSAVLPEKDQSILFHAHRQHLTIAELTLRHSTQPYCSCALQLQCFAVLDADGRSYRGFGTCANGACYQARPIQCTWVLGPQGPGGQCFTHLFPHIQCHCISGVVFFFVCFSSALVLWAAASRGFLTRHMEMITQAQTHHGYS